MCKKKQSGHNTCEERMRGKIIRFIICRRYAVRCTRCRSRRRRPRLPPPPPPPPVKRAVSPNLRSAPIFTMRGCNCRNISMLHCRPAWINRCTPIMVSFDCLPDKILFQSVCVCVCFWSLVLVAGRSSFLLVLRTSN